MLAPIRAVGVIVFKEGTSEAATLTNWLVLTSIRETSSSGNQGKLTTPTRNHHIIGKTAINTQRSIGLSDNMALFFQRCGIPQYRCPGLLEQSIRRLNKAVLVHSSIVDNYVMRPMLGPSGFQSGNSTIVRGVHVSNIETARSRVKPPGPSALVDACE